MQRILVVDDEAKIAAVVTDYLQHAGFQVTVAGTAAAALELARSLQPDLVVLDLGLPDGDGLDVARALRRHSAVPIIMLTARTEETDRILGLELGADDYVPKPFSPGELVARIRAVLRRGERAPASATRVRAGDVVVDLERRVVTVADRAVDLTPTEFELLLTLAREPGRVFTRRQLLGAVPHADGDESDRAVDAHVKNLRRKVEDDPHRPTRVLTVHGIGYRCAP